MKKLRNKIKQQMLESYERNKDRAKDDFEDIWKRSRKTARRLYNFGKNKEFKDISKQTQIFFTDDLMYSNTGFTFNSILAGSKLGNIAEDFERAEFEIYEKRVENFMRLNGDGFLKYDNKTLTLYQWLQEYKNKNIDKSEMNEIIKLYKEQNPDRSMYYSDSNANNDDFAENGFY